MNQNKLTPKKSLNKAFLKQGIDRKTIENFKENFDKLLNNTNDNESEEYNKNLIREFMNDSYYKNDFYINTTGRQDLVIHNGDNANTPVGVIIETKKITNKAEMVFCDNLNTKAMQELLWYFLNERIIKKLNILLFQMSMSGLFLMQ